MKKPDNKDNELFPALPELKSQSSNIDRRSFIIRNAVIGAAAVMTGRVWTTEARAGQAAKEAKKEAGKGAPMGSAALSPDLDIVRQSKGPVMTILEEFYKVGPGPSSSHTIGPMRITYDFYQRCTKLPADKLAKATGLKVHLFGSLSAPRSPAASARSRRRSNPSSSMGSRPIRIRRSR